MAAVLEVKNLKKVYGKLVAVDGLDLSIKSGICFGLLGPNGAGKSTTLEIIEGLREPTSGEIYFQGKPRDRSFRYRIGIQFQSTALQDFMTVREALELFASFYGYEENIPSVIQDCDLSEFLDQDHHKVSGGQRQRMLLAIALINDPDLLFLDEPTTGLDPHARTNFWDLIQKIKKREKTIVLTTHYMEEAYVLCDEIAIMDKGKIIEEGTPEELLAKHFQSRRISFPSSMKDELGKKLDWEWQEVHGRVEHFTSDINRSVREMLDRSVEVDNMEIRSQTLEDLFINLTTQGART